MMSVADWSGSHLNWDRDLVSWKERIDAVFGRWELKESCGYFLDGLLSGIERETGWMMAEQASPEQASLERPWRMQALLDLSRNESDNRRLKLMTAPVHSVPEIRYLLAKLILEPPASISFILERSLWRRRCQPVSAMAHYKKRTMRNYSTRAFCH